MIDFYYRKEMMKGKMKAKNEKSNLIRGWFEAIKMASVRLTKIAVVAWWLMVLRLPLIRHRSRPFERGGQYNVSYFKNTRKNFFYCCKNPNFHAKKVTKIRESLISSKIQSTFILTKKISKNVTIFFLISMFNFGTKFQILKKIKS